MSPRLDPTDSYAEARALERALGDPWSGEGPFSLRRAVERDEAEAYPDEVLAGLAGQGLAECFVPDAYGGRLRTIEGLAAVIRAIARRDMSAAIAASQSFLGAAPVWFAGTEAQRLRLAELVRSGARLSLALTEEAHGSDLAATDVVAARDGEGWRLDGEKWLVGHGERASAVTVLARTERSGGPRGFTLFLVDRASIAPATYRPLAKIRTSGVRGAEVSGVRFEGCRLRGDAVIGDVGAGLEVALCSLLVSRAGCAHLSLGSAETGLRLGLEFALERRLYGRRLFDLPEPRRLLTTAFVDLLIGEALAVAAVRAAHVVPEQLPLLAAAAKAVVPPLVDRLLRDVAQVVGARALLREHFQWGALQKVVRDASVVAVFDGSTGVNLAAIASQLWSVCGGAGAGPRIDPQRPGRLAAIFDLDAPLPRFDPERIGLDCRGRDDVIAGLWTDCRELERSDAPDPDGSVPRDLLARAVRDDLAALRSEHLRIARTLQCLRAEGRDALLRSSVAVELARRYGLLLAAAACVRLALTPPARAPDLLRGPAALSLCLDRVLCSFDADRALRLPPALDWGGRALERLHACGRRLSRLPLEDDGVSVGD